MNTHGCVAGKRGRKHGRITRAVLLAFALTAATSIVAAADDEKIIYPGAAKAEAPAAPAKGSMSSLSLVLGLGLAGVGGWLVWRNRRSAPGGREQRSLAIDETRSLGNRQYLVVASYEGKKFLLGVCPGRIDMLSSLSGPAAERTVRE